MSDTTENMRGTRNTNTRTGTPNSIPPVNAPISPPSQLDSISISPSNQNNSPSIPLDSNSNPAPTSAQPSLAQRVQNSATGLARSAFSAQNPHSGAAHVLSDSINGKAGSGPASGPSTGTGYLVSQETRGSGSGALGQSTSTGALQDGFRNTTDDPRGDGAVQGGFSIPALSAEKFQNEYGYEDALAQAQESTDLSTGTGARSSAESLQSPGAGKWKGKQRAQDPIQGEYTTAWQRANAKTGVDTLSSTADTDGAAVVSLLSDRSFDASFITEFNPVLDLDLDPDAAPPPLTTEEIKLLESFRREIAQEKNAGNIPSTLPVSSNPQLSSLSLVPDIDTFLQQNDPAGYTQSHGIKTAGVNTFLRDDVLANLPGAEDWVSVHERYHDEVWGYLRPALEAAKTEMEENKQSEEDYEDGPAVRRLKMILKHMKA
ncbi:uncharacterized protein N7483_006029 [Penicillium malachiteum]|uniref:uncharacterized protein n=1 Tax=Penicillium malachiteum TaxID=1324776 RepID=UPI0025475FCC|nr:uncharacterized protein N7483_006029 [Penicillium malachiteum]KAJ5731521.1 hypothetical protein N7483_006029 [Penicillium malachiteum]